MKKSLKRMICCVLIATIIFPVIALSLTVSANTINDPSVIPTPKYKYNVITRRNVDLGGSRSNTVDERFFVWPEYQMAFHDFIMNPFDISKADYLEFDIYSDIATSMQISVGSQSTTRNPIYNNYFEFYDIRSNKKSLSLNAGWNHIVIDTKNEFLVQAADTTYPGTYDYRAVDGIILHGPNSDYIRLTNIAFTSIKEVKPNNDNVQEEIIPDNEEIIPDNLELYL